MNPRVAVLLYQGCAVAEVLETATRLRRGRVDVRFVGTTTAELTDASGLRITPDSAIRDIDASQLGALVVPGGDPGPIIGDEQVRDLARTVAATGGVTAGICGGVIVLGDAGLLTDKRITHNYRAPWAPPAAEQHVAPLLADSIVEPDLTRGVVRDGSVITALPNAAVAFALEICMALDVVDAPLAAMLQRHLTGEFVEELFE